MINKIKFQLTANRIGPDMIFTHFLLHSKRLSKWLCCRKFLSFGENSSFRPGAYAIETKKIKIGKGVTIRPNTMLFASPIESESPHIIICDNALIGSGVHVYVSNHKYNDASTPIHLQGHEVPKKVIINKNCWIGANAIILPGVEIGQGSVVAAGSVVTKSVESFCVVAGVPAKIIKRLSPND
ncbi:MAG: acetyltransferase [Pseudoalteromonas sp.]|nr:MAG: acetyltransferase [Pseudoalteromonas sp.]